MKDKIALIISSGFGDVVTYMARLQSLLNKEQVKSVDVYVLSTYKGVQYMILDYIELSPIVDKVYYGRMPSGNIYKNTVDWRPDDSPLPYPVDPNYKFPYSNGDIKWALGILEGIHNPIIMYPYTLNGNPWAETEKYVRSPQENWWKQLFKNIKIAGGSPIVIGGEDEYIDWDDNNVISAYTDKDTFLHNMPLILNSKGYIGISSWPYMVAHYAGNIDTVVIMLYNHQWKERHLAKDRSKITTFLEVPTHEEIIKSMEVLRNDK